MASAAVSNRKPGWKPSSVGIGSSLTLSGVGSKPSPYLDKDLTIPLPSKSFHFPKVGSNERRAKSAPKAVDYWKNPQTSSKLLLTCCPMSGTERLDDNEQTDITSLTIDNPDFQKWAKKSEYYQSTGVLIGQREQAQEPDKDLLLELDDVRKQLQNSPADLILSIKAVMAEKRKRIITAKAAQLNVHSNPSTSKDMPSNANDISGKMDTTTQPSMEEGVERKVRASVPSVMTYHEILRAAISNNCSGSSSVNAFVNSSELPAYSDRDNSSRQTSSSSSTSIALERKGYSRTSQQPANKQTRHKTNGLTHSHDRHPSSDTLPVVYTDENANTTLHALTLGTRQVRTQPSMQPTASNHKTNPTTSSKTQRIDSLSISGIKQDNSSANLRAEETTPEEEDCRPTRLATAERLTPKASPPSLQLYTNTTQQSNGATSQSYSLPTRRKPSKTQHSSGGRSLHGKQKQDPEPKYADPIVGATTSFQARLAELASLEAETVRWERLRKLKKKARDD